MTFLLEQDATVRPLCDEHLPEEAREMRQKLREMDQHPLEASALAREL
jgi:hypothetical protein